MSYTPDEPALRSDVEALAALVRDSAGSGEREAAAWANGRLTAAGAQDARLQTYRGRATNSWSFAAHGLAGLVALRVRGIAGFALAALAAISLERDASGRAPWRRRVVGGGEGANAVARIPARGAARCTAVVVAHIDAARTGLAWSPRATALGGARNLRTHSAPPVMALHALGLALAALAALMPARIAARRVLSVPAALLNGAATVLNLDIARSPVVPGANDNATGVAAAIDLARALAADPLEHVEVIVALVGGEESGMGGFHALLEEDPPLDPARTFVLGLDTLGSGIPILAEAEGAVATHRYRPADLEIADEGAALAGEPAPERWRIGAWTDPLLALNRGIPAVSLLSMGPDGHYTHYHHPTDLPEHVDFRSVAACARIAHGTLRALDRRSAPTA
ncbi:MAG: M28 family peptidase [Actinomycetes bacterium]